jgi:hypothetical protein
MPAHCANRASALKVRICVRTLGVLLCLIAAGLPAKAQNTPPPPADATAQAEAPPKLTPEQLDQLCAPIALYPDALLAQVLMASAYPLDVVAADRWMAKNGNLTGDQMEKALEGEPWDISVKVLTHFPSVLKYMDENLDWTQALGDAFVNQQADVMASVQHLRQEAYAAGNLKSGPQQTVTNSSDGIVIDPADGQTVYVPQYNPQVVYTQGPTTVVTTGGATTVVTQPTTVVTQPGYSATDVAVTGLLSFTAGVVVGSLINNNNNWCNWGGGYVYAPIYHGGGYGWSGWGRPPPGWGYNGWNQGGHYGNNNININNNGNININNGGGQRWQPNNSRRPTPYGGKGATTRPVARDFGYGTPGKPGAAGTLPANQNRPNQAGGSNAFSGYGRGAGTAQASTRGAQSLNSSTRPNNYKPPAQGSATRPANIKPATTKPAGGGNFQPQKPGGYKPQAANPNRGGNVFGGGNGGFDRSASQRGAGSMGSAKKSGFRPQGRR